MIPLLLALALDITCSPATLKARKKDQAVTCYAVLTEPAPSRASCAWSWDEMKSESADCEDLQVVDGHHRYSTLTDGRPAFMVEFSVFGKDGWLIASGGYALRVEDK